MWLTSKKSKAMQPSRRTCIHIHLLTADCILSYNAYNAHSSILVPL